MPFDLLNEVKQQLNRKDTLPDIGMPDVPQDVRLFLGRLSLLQGVPIYYLLPEERYLPKTTTTVFINGQPEELERGSIRAFRLDKEWIECLLDGALSLGPGDDRQQLLAEAMSGKYAAEVFYNDSKEKIKKQLYGLYQPEEHAAQLDRRLREKNIVPVDGTEPQPTIAQSNWRYSGFFLRSSIMTSWVGVEVVAEGTESDTGEAVAVRPLQVVRFERIAPDTIFCICEGLISEIQITQPPEGTHFALTQANDGKYEAVRMPDNTKVEVALRPRSVLNIRDLSVLNIRDLVSAGKLNVGDSAHFAQALLSKPLQVTLKMTWAEEAAVS